VAEWEYAGPGPVEDGAGGIVHPGDRREMAEPPPWGPWNPVPHVSGEVPEDPAPGGERQSAAGQAPAQAGANGGQSSVTPPVALAAKPEGA
jgi:hypothetical protein